MVEAIRSRPDGRGKLCFGVRFLMPREIRIMPEPSSSLGARSTPAPVGPALGLAIALAAGLLLGPVAVEAQTTGTLRGTVLSSNTMRPLPGAQITLPGTGRGSLTNQQGVYVLENLPVGEHLVRAQMLGYGTAEGQVTVIAGQVVEMDFQLGQQALALDEVVVTGQAGQARRREVGNAITQVNMRSVLEPIQSVETLLQGRAPGVRVTIGDAQVGSGAAIRLRGNVSVSQSNQPLIYVDGVRQAGDAYRSGGNTRSSGPLGDINPNDIDRIEVIKGAAAATLYGSEAAAGVIQIFTRRGAEADVQFTYQIDQSLSWVRPWGSTERPRLDMDPWLRTGYGHTHVLSAAGGASRIRYFVSGNYTDRFGAQVDEEENRYGLRTNVTIDATDRLSFDISSMFALHDFQTMPSGNALHSIFFNVYRAPNNFVGGAMPGDPAFVEQINTLRARTVETTNQRAVLGFTGNWNPSEALSSRFTVGFDRMSQDQMTVLPYGFPTNPDGSINTAAWHNQSLTADLATSYRLGLPGGILSTWSAGGQLVQRETHQLVGTGSGLPGPGLHTLSSTADRNVTQSGETVNTGGFFFQSMLDFNDRFFLTMGVRMDGSSAFGSDFGLEVYPKVSGSWIVSEESFWPAGLGDVKLRAAYGYAGRAPGAFDAVRTWNPTSYLSQTAFTPANVGNPDLGPERTGELEVGFDGAFIDDRLTLDVTYYRQRTSEALLNVGQAPSLGFGGSQLENVGALMNEGFEIGADFTVLNRPTLLWSVGTDISTNKSEVLDMGGVVSYSLVEGHPAPVQRGAKILNPDEFADPEYEIDAFLGPNEPTHIIGLNTRFELPRGISVTARGEYLGGHWARDFASNLMAQRAGPGALGCDHVYRIIPHDGSYLGPGDTHPNLDQVRAKDRALCFTRSRADAWNLPMDFAKLREITVQAPIVFLLPMTQGATATASVRNLFRWVNSEFYSHDPETTGAGNLITSLTGGAITDHVPAPASFTFSVRVMF
jgi:TonB-dependent starch-binding outer membrane protein SusC